MCAIVVELVFFDAHLFAHRGDFFCHVGEGAVAAFCLARFGENICEVLNFISNDDEVLDFGITVIMIDLADLAPDMLASHLSSMGTAVLLVLIFENSFAGAVHTEAVVAVI